MSEAQEKEGTLWNEWNGFLGLYLLHLVLRHLQATWCDMKSTQNPKDKWGASENLETLKNFSIYILRVMKRIVVLETEQVLMIEPGPSGRSETRRA